MAVAPPLLTPVAPPPPHSQVLRSIMAVNDDSSVHGLIVQLPLDSAHPIDSELITNAVSPEKDVDGWAGLH